MIILINSLIIAHSSLRTQIIVTFDISVVRACSFSLSLVWQFFLLSMSLRSAVSDTLVITNIEETKSHHGNSRRTRILEIDPGNRGTRERRVHAGE